MINVLEVRNLSFRYRQHNVLHDLSFSVAKGEIFGILGPNGSGKTTLLKLLGKELPLQTGTITVNGKPLASFSQKEWARYTAVLPQTVDATFGYTVKETVELGRYAHQSGWLPTWTDEDDQAVKTAIEQAGLLDKADENIDRLSGGERQRAFLARALAQQPQLLLLDEPTNHMDITQQMKLLDRLICWAREKALTVIAIFHDLNMASLYCDRLLLLQNGKRAALGTPEELMEPARLQAVFDAPVIRQNHPLVPKPVMSFFRDWHKPLEGGLLDQLTLERFADRVVVTAKHPLKVLSSALVGSGFQWATRFVNRQVSFDYHYDDAESEMKAYLQRHGIPGQRTIGMMTAVTVEDCASVHVTGDGFSVWTVVTAGTGNAVDAAHAWKREKAVQTVGTINVMVFVEGTLTDAAYVQALMTATEAKTKVLYESNILDPETNTPATGTSTDCIAIAATQTGETFSYAGTITPLGKAIGRSVYEATKEALQRYQSRMKQ